MTTSYWFVRHGPTHATGFCGHTDLPADLSDAAQIARLKAYLPADAKILSSDLSRARETARAIHSHQLWLPEAPALREMNFGDWEGKGFASVEKNNPDLWRSFWEEPGDIAPPNGESWHQLSLRINEALAALHSAGPQGDIIITAHFAVILAALQQATGMTPKAVFSFKIDNFSVTRLDYLHKSNNWRVVQVNHLP
ncbi:MAG: histidine phosphatase family protein [Rhodobacteraceae bacterium]|nr:histidine phosphatase family protein [Paracoccaceae bacterium]